jgi:hypothetical protein
MKIEGERGLQFGIYTLDIDESPYERVFECETIAEVESYRWRNDKRYKIQVPGRRYLTRSEFAAWKTQQKT